MKFELHENLSSLDRTLRIIIGTGICLSILFVPLGTTWIAVLSFAAMYPLLSGMTAIDPLFALIENIFPESDYKFNHKFKDKGEIYSHSAM